MAPPASNLAVVGGRTRTLALQRDYTSPGPTTNPQQATRILGFVRDAKDKWQAEMWLGTTASRPGQRVGHQVLALRQCCQSLSEETPIASHPGAFWNGWTDKPRCQVHSTKWSLAGLVNRGTRRARFGKGPRASRLDCHPTGPSLGGPRISVQCMSAGLAQ